MPECGCLSFPKEAGKISKQRFRCPPSLDPDLMEPSGDQAEQLMALSLLLGQALIDLGICGPCVKFPAPGNEIQGDLSHQGMDRSPSMEMVPHCQVWKNTWRFPGCSDK